MSNGNYNMNPGSKEKDTEGTFNQKQSDTISKLTPKPKKLSRKERKANEAKKQKFQNYVAESKRHFPNFEQEKDTVVSTTGTYGGAGFRLRHQRNTKGANRVYGEKIDRTELQKTGKATFLTKIPKAKIK